MGLDQNLLDQGNVTAELLNTRRGLRMLRELIDGLRIYPSVFEASWRKSTKRMTPELVALEDKLDRQWKRYDSRQFHYFDEGRRELTLGREFIAAKLPVIEQQLFRIVERLIEHGEFRRLRRCVNCGKWLFAGRRRDKTNCSERCRQARYERTPKRQASNPVRAAEYYRRTLKSYRKRSKKER